MSSNLFLAMAITLFVGMPQGQWAAGPLVVESEIDHDEL